MDAKRKPLKVVFVLPDLTGGGAERVTLTLLRHFDRSVIAPALFLFRREGEYLDDIPPDVPLHVGAVGGRRMPGVALRRLAAVVADSDVVVGALELKSILAVVYASLVTGRPAVGWVHKNLDYYLRSCGRVKALIYAALVRVAFRRLRRVVGVSGGVAKALRDRFAALSPCISFIYNPLDIADIHRQAELPVPEWFAALHDRPVVLAVGRLERQKGFDILLRAHAALIARGVPHYLVILGDGAERRRLELLAVELGVADTVRLPGFCNPYPLMRRSQLYALSSRYEGLPTVLMEAQCLGLPVIAADCPSGPAEILGDGAYGVLVPTEDAAALTDALAFALGHRDDMRELAHAGVEHAQTYALDTVCRSWQRVLLTAGGRA